jgi:hypothetical protein
MHGNIKISSRMIGKGRAEENREKGRTENREGQRK